MLQVHEQVLWALRILPEQEHQPWQPHLTRSDELQLRVRHLRLVAHRRPVPEPRHQHVHVRVSDGLPAHLRRLDVPRGEICHIGDGIARPRHRRLRRRHKRPRRRQPPQLTGVTKNGEPRAFRTADLQ